MFLKELELGHEAKCNCETCNGTGIYKGFAEKEDLGVICTHCNGLGYYTIALDENTKLVQDEQNGVVYRVEEGIIENPVRLFTQLAKREDVNYVIHSTGRVFSPEWLFENGASEINVIRYEEFYNGMLPMPMVQYTCPRQLSQSYGHAEFDNDCSFGSFSDCKKFGKRECWDKFYGNATTIEEKQAVLRKIR